MTSNKDSKESSSNPLDALASAVGLPSGTREFINKIVDGAADEAGRRTLQALIVAWDRTGGGPFAIGTIGSLSVEKATDMLIDRSLKNVFDKLLSAIGADQMRLRAALCGSQLLGLGLLRYVSKSEPLASASVDEVVDAMAPTLQRYLTGDISAGA